MCRLGLTKRLAVCLWCLLVACLVGLGIAGHFAGQVLLGLITPAAEAAPSPPRTATYIVAQVPGGYRLALAGEVCKTPGELAGKVEKLRAYCARRGIGLELWVADPCPCHCAQCECPDPCPCGGRLVPGPKVRVGIDLTIRRHLETVERLRIKHAPKIKDKKYRQLEKK